MYLTVSLVFCLSFEVGLDLITDWRTIVIDDARDRAVKLGGRARAFVLFLRRDTI